MLFFPKDGFFSPKQVSLLKNKLADLLAEIRPNAVALVDAFDYPDKILDSCLGRYDGQVYQALYDYAKSSPLNQQEVCFPMNHDMGQFLIDFVKTIWDFIAYYGYIFSTHPIQFKGFIRLNVLHNFRQI